MFIWLNFIHIDECSRRHLQFCMSCMAHTCFHLWNYEMVSTQISILSLSVLNCFTLNLHRFPFSFRILSLHSFFVSFSRSFFHSSFSSFYRSLIPSLSLALFKIPVLSLLSCYCVPVQAQLRSIRESSTIFWSHSKTVIYTKPGNELHLNSKILEALLSTFHYGLI